LIRATGRLPPNARSTALNLLCSVPLQVIDYSYGGVARQPGHPDPFASFRGARLIGAARTFYASRATKDQEPTKGRSGGTAMFWKFIDVVAAIAMAIAVLN
jgi:hypothetical protein